MTLKNKNKETLENKKYTGLIDEQTNKVALESTQGIFESILEFDNFRLIANDISKAIVSDLEDEGFMSNDISLNDKQKSILLKDIEQIVSKAVSVYVANLNKDNRTKNIASTIIGSIKNVIDEAFKNVAYEINRGTLINTIIVSADAKKEDYNKLELHYSKRTVDVAIPTQAILISTNVIEVLKSSIKIVLENGEILGGNVDEESKQ